MRVLVWPELKRGELVDVWSDLIRCEEVQKKIIGRWHEATQARSTSQNFKWRETTHLITCFIRKEAFIIKFGMNISSLNRNIPSQPVNSTRFWVPLLNQELFHTLLLSLSQADLEKKCCLNRRWATSPFMYQLKDMDVSENNGTPKTSNFNRVFHYKPCILGYPCFWKHPYGRQWCSMIWVPFDQITAKLPSSIVVSRMNLEWLVHAWSDWDRNSGNWKKEFGTENLPRIGSYFCGDLMSIVLKNDNSVSGKAYVKLYPKLISYLMFIASIQFLPPFNQQLSYPILSILWFRNPCCLKPALLPCVRRLN